MTPQVQFRRVHVAPLPRTQQLLVLLLLSFLTFFLGLGRQAITDTDEAFYAEAAREMVEGGDWLTPHFNYEDRWQKPVLYYWLAAGTYALTGPSEWSARFPSALSGLALVLLTWLSARRLAGDAAAFLAGLIVASSYGYFAMARLALPDLPLALLVTCTIWLALEQRWAMAGIAAGLGFLMKGPIALLIPLLVVVPILWREQGVTFLRRLPWRAVMFGLLLFAIVGLPWYIAMTLTHGTAYLRSFFIADNLERFATTRYNDLRSVLFYVPIVIGGVMPWSIYLLVLPWERAIAVVRRREWLNADEWRLLIWMLAPLIFFTVSIGKQPRYVLPVLPPLAILLARSIAARISDARPGDSSRGLRVATWLTAAMFLVLAVLLFRARVLFVDAFPLLTIGGVVALAVAALATAWIAASRSWRQLPAVLAASGVAMLLAMQFGALAGRKPEPVEELATLMRAHRTNERVGEYQAFVRNLVFYTGFKHVDLFNEQMAIDFLRSPERVLLVVRQDDLLRFTSSNPDIRATILGGVRYLDPADVRLRSLLWPDPSEVVDTVVLVENR